MTGRAFLFLAVLSRFVFAHPLTNTSVSHYTRLEVSAHSVEVTYVLDLAEVPSYSLLRDWKLDAGSPPDQLQRKAEEQARLWAHGLEFGAAGTPAEAQFVGAKITLSKGVDGLATMRVESTFTLPGATRPLVFEDHNFPERAGWKEIVIRGAGIESASHAGTDRSQELTRYPADALASAPQDLRARVDWRAGSGNAPARIVAIAQPAPVPFDTTAQTGPPATEIKRDFLSRLLNRKEIGWGWMLVGLAVAFGLGGAHALTPGHGKTIVAAYLVGSRGTMKQAAFLGGMVTFTHTISVFLLGIGTLLFSSYVDAGKASRVMGVISGVAIVLVGASLFFERYRKLRGAGAHHHHHHDQHHDHDHHHHDHQHDDPHQHGHGSHTHSHVPEGEVTLASLTALGVSGGLVPCPSALVLLLASIALGHVGAGLILLVAFSLGLAGVLMAVGMIVLYAKSWLPDPEHTSRHPFFRLVPVLSAAVIVCLGLLMTGVSLGWVAPGLAG
jgi:ABC-type nickel/cobalt efflux system permease component RcnA